MSEQVTPLIVPITAYEVMKCRAKVTRQLKLDEKFSGRRELVITSLPLLLDESSLRVEFSGTARLSQLALRLAYISDKTVNSTAAKKINAEISHIDEQIAWYKAEIGRLQEPDLELPDEMLEPHRYDNDKPVAAWQSYLAVRGELCQEHYQAIENLAERKNELLEQLKEVANNKSASSDAKAVRELVVSLQAPLSGVNTITISYQVYGAFWRPAYELRLTSGNERAVLTVAADIAQMTGEEWPAAPLNLSTSDITREAAVPRLDSWHIGREEEKASSWRELPADSAKLLADYQAFVEKCQKEKFEQLAKPQLAAPPMMGMAAMPPMPGGAVMGAVPQMAAPPMVERMVESCPAMPAPGGRRLLRSAAKACGGAVMRESAACEDMAVCDEECAEAMACETPAAAGTTMAEVTLLDYSLLEMAGAGMPHAGELQKAVDRPAAEVIAKARHQADSQISGNNLKNSHSRADNFKVNYSSFAPLAIPADGLWHKIALFSLELPLKLEYWAIPRQETSLFRCGQMTNTSSYALLGGPLDVYWDNQLLLNTTLGNTVCGAEIAIPLGIEERCEIRRTVAHTERQSGILSQSTIYNDQVTIEIASQLANEIEIHVIDRIPVCYAEGVKINITAINPEQTAFAASDGTKLPAGALGWLVKAGNKQPVVIKFGYDIELPARQEIVGGGKRA